MAKPSFQSFVDSLGDAALNATQNKSRAVESVKPKLVPHCDCESLAAGRSYVGIFKPTTTVDGETCSKCGHYFLLKGLGYETE